MLLATPTVWMAWAMLLFISAVMSFVCRIGISTVLALGVIYFGMIVKTLRGVVLMAQRQQTSCARGTRGYTVAGGSANRVRRCMCGDERKTQSRLDDGAARKARGTP